MRVVPSAAGWEAVGSEDTGVRHPGLAKDPDGAVLTPRRRYASRRRRGEG